MQIQARKPERRNQVISRTIDIVSIQNACLGLANWPIKIAPFLAAMLALLLAIVLQDRLDPLPVCARLGAAATA